MSYKTCEVCRLKSGRKGNEKRVFMAKFPLEEARCKQWVKVIGNSDLAYVPIEKLHTLKFVCGKHFKPTDFKKKKTRLKKSAVPSLLMNREPLKDDLLENFPLHIAKKNVIIGLTVDSSYNTNTEHNYFKLQTPEMERLHSSDFIWLKDTDANDSRPTILQRISNQTSNHVGRSRSYSRSPSNRASRSRSRSRISISEMDIRVEVKLEEQLSDHSLSEVWDIQKSPTRDRQISPKWDIQKSPTRDRQMSPRWDRYRSPERSDQRDIDQTIIKNEPIECDSFPVLNDILSDFDPLCKEQPINAWLAKVEEYANIYRWKEQQIIYYALSKLSGQAKLWYQDLPSRNRSWLQWKALLTESFSANENYAELLTEMLGKKTRVGESFELYYYSKINLLNRCNIFGKKAVDCLVHGIDDISVRVGVQAANFEKPEEVLQFFKTATLHPKDFKSNNEIHRSSTNNNTFVNGLNNKVCDEGQVYLWANWT